MLKFRNIFCWKFVCIFSVFFLSSRGFLEVLTVLWFFLSLSREFRFCLFHWQPEKYSKNPYLSFFDKELAVSKGSSFAFTRPILFTILWIVSGTAAAETSSCETKLVSVWFTCKSQNTSSRVWATVGVFCLHSTGDSDGSQNSVLSETVSLWSALEVAVFLFNRTIDANFKQDLAANSPLPIHSKFGPN